MQNVQSNNAPESLDASEAYTVKTDQSILESISSIGDNSEVFEEGLQIKQSNLDGVRKQTINSANVLPRYMYFVYILVFNTRNHSDRNLGKRKRPIS